MDLVFADYTYAAFFGWLCLAVSLIFVYRWPVANAFLPLSVTGLGGVSLVGGVTYARISSVVGLLTLLGLALRGKQEGVRSNKSRFHTPLAWFAIVCLVIGAKILAETALYGFDASRQVLLTNGLLDGLYPILVLLLGIRSIGLQASERQMLIGMFVLPTLTTIGYIMFSLRQGMLLSAWSGADRFTFGVVNSINSARVITYAAIGSLLVFTLQRRQNSFIGILAFGVSMGLMLLEVLTGTRQYIIALVGFLLLWVSFLQSSSVARWLLSIFLLVGIIYSVGRLVKSSDMAVAERVSAVELRAELTESRGLIWTKAFNAMADNLLLGVGFNRFGEEYDTIDKRGRPMAIRDSAHGFVQDVFTEHGLFLGTLFLIGSIQLLARSIQSVQHEPAISERKALMVGLIALVLPLPFSSVFLNATPIFLLLVLTMTQDSLRSDPGMNDEERVG